MTAGPTLGALLALGAALTWALTSLLVRPMLAHHGSVAINATRTTAGGALLVGWVTATGSAADVAGLSPTGLLLLVGSIVVAIGVGDTVFFESTRMIGLGRAMTISMTYPVGAALLAAVALREPITLPVAAGTLLTLAGLVLIVGARAVGEPVVRPDWWGIGAAALASLAWALSVVMMKRPLDEVDPITAQAIRLPLAGLMLWATPWARRAAPGLRGGPVVARLAVLSLLSAASSVMFVGGLKYAGVAVAAVLSSTAPLFAIPLGMIFLGERLPARAVAGAAVTVTGIIVLRL